MDDYDLSACLRYNPQDGFSEQDINQILAVWEGENDGPPWHWILSLKDHRYIYLTGGCDYTGWDCQSGASHQVISDPKEFLAGYGAYNVLEGQEGDMSPEIISSLLRQLDDGKETTWREKKDEEFGVTSVFAGESDIQDLFRTN